MSEIESLKSLFAKQKAAFSANPYPSKKEREDRLDAIIGAVLANRDKIHAAFKEDFSAHPNAQADFIEIFGVVERLHYARSMLSDWMAQDARAMNPDMYGNSKAFVLAQPKGVIGNMVPWNFPFDIGLGHSLKCWPAEQCDHQAFGHDARLWRIDEGDAAGRDQRRHCRGGQWRR